MPDCGTDCYALGIPKPNAEKCSKTDSEVAENDLNERGASVSLQGYHSVSGPKTEAHTQIQESSKSSSESVSPCQS